MQSLSIQQADTKPELPRGTEAGDSHIQRRQRSSSRPTNASATHSSSSRKTGPTPAAAEGLGPLQLHLECKQSQRKWRGEPRQRTHKLTAAGSTASLTATAASKQTILR